MRVAVRKWGNSLALRIPKSLASDSEIEQGSLVEVSVVRGKLVVTPVRVPKYSLKQLLSGVRKRHLHGEVDTGAPVGRESW
ncbi:MAG: AbrB/MazE/SpoVT family DNA-binding domain-containing protein [Deltaproteobacteria bacterium]|nr:AbrB/MazE/SpoVT family DNA-binding domain-containing protein [Deltaproteobacteria bacterium]MBI3078107.1 AbrB/MazE/SpoVT family DNA-binding domain-containing protein [Deltaproteobacteria bacterium]